MNPPQINETIENAIRAGLPEHIRDEQITVRKNGGIWHGSRRWCYEIGQSGTPEQRTLREIETAKVCTCLQYELGGPEYRLYHIISKNHTAAVLSAHHHGNGLLDEIEKLTSRYESGKGRKPAIGLSAQLRNRAYELRQVLTFLTGQSAQYKSAHGELEDRLNTTLEKLAKAAGGSDHNQRVLEKIKKHHTPKSWKGETPSLDETPLVVGIAPPRPGPNRELRLVLDATRIHAGTEGHLYIMPRYVYEYVQRAFPLGSYTMMHMQAIEHPGEIIEMLPGLWSPGDTSPLRDLNKAIEAAHILQAQQ